MGCRRARDRSRRSPCRAGLVALVRPRGRRAAGRAALHVRRPECMATLAIFGLYTAVKAAYLSTHVRDRDRGAATSSTSSRSCSSGTALVLAQRRPALLAVGAATAFVVYLVTSTPYTLAEYPNYEAHGLAIAAFANRIPRGRRRRSRRSLVLLTLGSVARACPPRSSAHLGSRPPLSAPRGVVVSWSLTTEIYAASGERAASDQINGESAEAGRLGRPDDGRRVDALRGPGNRAFARLAARVLEPTVRCFWGIDGSAPDPASGYAEPARPDGTHAPAD